MFVPFLESQLPYDFRIDHSTMRMFFPEILYLQKFWVNKIRAFSRSRKEKLPEIFTFSIKARIYRLLKKTLTIFRFPLLLARRTSSHSSLAQRPIYLGHLL